MIACCPKVFSRKAACCSHSHLAFLPLAAVKRFQDSGLERAGPLEQDIQHLSQEYNLQVPQPAEDGPGRAYARYVGSTCSRPYPPAACTSNAA